MKILVCFLLAGTLLFSCSSGKFSVDDKNGELGQTNAPVSVHLKLNKHQLDAAKDGRMGIVEGKGENKTIIPVQIEDSKNGTDSEITFLMPDGKPGVREFELVEIKSPRKKLMKAGVDEQTGQTVIEEAGKKVLQYNYKTVYEKDVIRNELIDHKTQKYSPVGGIYLEKYFKAHPGISKDTVVTTQIYAVPRSDYIHPLYGLNGEMLTRDWPDTGHPHHRGIFWAWPEVMYGSELGDIYALQRVFARPTGNIKYMGGPVFAEIDAENLWMWENEPIVREVAVIRVYRAVRGKRIVDLAIKLIALKDSVTIATRETNRYGGLNIRMQTPGLQDISYFTDKKGAEPRRAWADFNGVFKGDNTPSGLMILQNASNPEYPGEWKEYPNLAWVQPTFPSPNTRYLLSKKEPLILRYRLIIHDGGRPSEEISKESWDAYNNPATPVLKSNIDND